MLSVFLQNWLHQLPWAIFLLLFSRILWKYITTPKNLPPGPWGMPFLGYAPFLGKKPQITIAKLKHKYGDIVRFKIFGREIVALLSYKAIKEAFVHQGDVFAARPDSMVPLQLQKTRGMVSSNGERWVELRRFSLTTLRNFGMGKSSMEERIMDEIHHYLEKIKSFQGQPADISSYLRISISNVICIVLTGKRYDYDDEIFKKLLQQMIEVMRLAAFNEPTEMIPDSLKFIKLFNLLGIKTVYASIEKVLNHLSSIMNLLISKYEPHKSDENFIYAWWTRSLKNDVKSRYFAKEQLPMVLQDFFIAGTDTTTTTLTWALLYLTKHPKVQEKVHKEIDDIIGKERSPAMSDQKLMPYTEATLMEVNRIASITPLGVFRCTCVDTILDGYLIPKNTVIMPNLWLVHHDPENFPDPHEFKPERFLTEDNKIKRFETLNPFGMGKRQCLGEGLARMELFLYLTSMLQQFIFKKPEAATEINLDYRFAIVLEPVKQKLCAIPR